MLNFNPSLLNSIDSPVELFSFVLFGCSFYIWLFFESFDKDLSMPIQS